MKKLLLICILSSLIFILSSCSHYIDTNGIEDYTLETLQEKDFYISNRVLEVNSYTSNKNNELVYRVEKLSGVRVLKAIRPKGVTTTVSVTLEVNCGNVRACLIANQEIVYEFLINDTSTYTIRESSDTFYFKIAGESANIKCTLKIK